MTEPGERVSSLTTFACSEAGTENVMTASGDAGSETAVGSASDSNTTRTAVLFLAGVGFAEVNSAKISPDQIASHQHVTTYPGSMESGSGQVRLLERCAIKLGSVQDGIGEISPGEVRVREVGSGEIGSGKVRVREIGSGEIGSSEIASDQVRPGQIHMRKLSLGQFDPGKIEAAQVGFAEPGPGQLRFLEIEFSQPGSVQMGIF